MELTEPSHQNTGVLRGAAAEWAALPVAEGLRLLMATRPRIVAVAERWVAESCRAKGIDPGAPAAGEEWLTGPYPLLRYVDALTRTLTAVRDGRDPLRGVRFSARPGGRTAVHVLPFDRADRLLLHGFRAEVWLAPGMDEAGARAGAGRGVRPEGGGVCVVLGAGNINSIAPLDVLHQLYAAGMVVLLKLNPVNDYLAPLLREVFAPFVARGFVRITTGGAAAGAALVRDPGVTAVHVTGSAATHDAIVFGPGPEGAARRAAGQPVLGKPVTSELGGVGPAVVLPGPWSRADLRYQARHLVAQKLNNNGFNCAAVQVVVVPEHWDARAEFLGELRSALRTAPARVAYYPGAGERRAGAVAGRTDVELLDSAEVPRTLLPDIAPDADDPAFRTEFFAPVLAVTALPGRTPAEFLDRAVEFCNSALSGTLGANLVAHPRTLRSLGPRFEEAVARLRYGTVGVNCWTAVGYALPRAVWGAYPGHTPVDVGSGIGTVHNALLLPGAERTVITGPFRPAPRSVLTGQWALSPVPPWFVDNRTSDGTGRRLLAYTARPSGRGLASVLWSALRG
ncbi:aldehyde dehydrogenase family protein [Streptomyces olivoreticuli]|uniref:aldehyde dehydrogenase family protein n=1 Tax=Streptomyces olivoreticuli TaxID=68246 RepID=UPI00265982C1|nr:aldehyde dehydrogenase family protein [Streptomyces olivoreticuli]WKK24862.1 aldehyde dehydrogenase family protein [Streptomyces olivoreticuli]